MFRTALYADWPLRLALAGVFLYHGFKHLDGGATAFAEGMGINETIANFVIIGEIFAGLAILYGGMNLPGASFFTRAAGLSVMVIMIGAIENSHWFRWAFNATPDFPMGGMEFQVVLMAVGLWFLLTGGRLQTASLLVNANAHWVPRSAFAAVFLYHGLDKFNNLEDFSAMMDLSEAVSFTVAYVEVAAGLLILISGLQSGIADWGTRVAGALIFPVMIGAIAKNHSGQWSFVPSADYPMGGMEFQVLMMALGSFFILRGLPEVELAPSGADAQAEAAGLEA